MYVKVYASGHAIPGARIYGISTVIAWDLSPLALNSGDAIGTRRQGGKTDQLMSYRVPCYQ